MPRSDNRRSRISPDQPISELARRVCRERLAVVRHYAPLAAKRWQEDAEYVHQLRVATRRARAALELFAPLLPRRKAKWIQRCLRTLRRAAGEARDLDVLLQRTRQSPRTNRPDDSAGSNRNRQRSGQDKRKREKERNRKGARRRDDERRRQTPAGKKRTAGIVKYIARERRDAQRPLVRAVRRAKQRGLKHRCRRLLVTVRWRSKGPEPSIATAAGNLLKPLLAEFIVIANEDRRDPATLHRMRIQGKRVRYALEILSLALGPSMRPVQEILVAAQDRLGAINDHAAAITRFQEWVEQADQKGSKKKRKRRRAALSHLIARHQLILEQLRQEFSRWWTRGRAEQIAAEIEGVLSNPAVAGGNPSGAGNDSG